MSCPSLIAAVILQDLEKPQAVENQNLIERPGRSRRQKKIAVERHRIRARLFLSMPLLQLHATASLAANVVPFGRLGWVVGSG
jgi:hypothetical protein